MQIKQLGIRKANTERQIQMLEKYSNNLLKGEAQQDDSNKPEDLAILLTESVQVQVEKFLNSFAENYLLFKGRIREVDDQVEGSFLFSLFSFV